VLVQHDMKASRGSGGIIPSFLTLTLDGGKWSISCGGRIHRRERAPGIQWIGGCVGHRFGVDAVEQRIICVWQVHGWDMYLFPNADKPKFL
jgi:hypothetical protein